MVEVVNSKEKPLPAPAIISMALEQQDAISGESEITPAATLAGITKELTMPSVDVAQVGNTVFVAHKGKDKNKHKLHGRLFNVDTARNLVNNTVKYFNVLQQKGITHYSAVFRAGTLEPVAKAVGQTFKGTGTKGYMVNSKDNKYVRVFFKFPQKGAS
tara:strand:+ start:87 stop:560 length:474 start_codon:yes stop_codon:yes gene_type:complete